MILGIDNGYNFTKTSEDVIFKSSAIAGKDDINDVLQVETNGSNYIIGTNSGDFIADSDKFKNEHNRNLLKLNTLTSIGLSYPIEKDINVKCVVGLPVNYFSNQKESFKKMLTGLKESIYINKIGFQQNITIEDVLVYPQTAGYVFANAEKCKDKDILVIDIGGGTWDISHFKNMILTNKATYTEGMLVLYSKISQFLNSKYYTKFDENDLYDLIQRNYFSVDGKKISTNIFDDIILNHVSKVMTRIKRDFDLAGMDNIILIGGGADELKDILIKYHIQNLECEQNSQFLNAKTFKIMGNLKFNS